LSPGPNSNPTLKRDKLYYGWIVLILLFVTGIIGLGIRFSFGVFFKSIQEDFGWGRTSTSGVYSVYMVLCAVSVILIGWALDRYGPRITLTAMGCFTALSLLLTSQVSSPWQLFITYSLLLAVGTGGFYLVPMATVNRWFTKRRGLALGIVGSGGTAGMMVIGPFAAYLISDYGWQTTCIILGSMALLIIIPCGQLLRKSPSEMKTPSESGSLETANHGLPVEQRYSEPGGLSLPQAVRTKNFWLLAFMLFLFGSSSYIIITHLVPHAIDLGINPIQAASLLSFVGGSGIAGRLLLGRASDSIGRKPAYLICSLLLAVAMLWLTKSSDLWMLYLFAALFGFAFGGFGSVNAAFIGDTFGLRHIGLIMGVAEVPWQIGATLGPVLAGYIFDVNDSYVFAFIAGMIAGLVVSALVFFLRTSKSPTP